MSTVIQDLPEIRIGRDWGLAVTEQTSLGNPFNMSGYTVELCIKINLTDSDSAALYKSASLATSNLSFGQYTIRIPNATTKLAAWNNAANSGATAVYEIIYKDPTGVLNTKFSGSVPITPSITVIIP